MNFMGYFLAECFMRITEPARYRLALRSYVSGCSSQEYNNVPVCVKLKYKIGMLKIQKQKEEVRQCNP